MKILRIPILVVVLAIPSIAAFTQTVIFVQDTIQENTTWSDDTVKVTGDLTILDNVVLTIEPGTYVEFQGHYAIYLQGTIYAVGTAEDSIIFTAKNTSQGWFGIRINNGSYDGLNGAMNDNQTSEFRFCRFSYTKPTGPNWNDNQGGVFYIFMFSKLIFSDCMFSHNSAKNGGGAMLCAGSSPHITRCTFYNNHADDSRGAALSFQNAVGVVCTHNIFIDNYGEVGGAIANSYSEMLIEHNIFLNNYATYYGGCIHSQGGYNMIISNNLMANNFAAEGGALYFSGSDPLIINTTIVNNFSGQGSGIYLGSNSNPVFYNSIIWGNERPGPNPNQFYLADDLSDPDLFGCVLEGGTAAIQLAASCQYTGQHENILDTDPLFVQASTSTGAGGGSLSDNWQLSSASPCINVFQNYFPSGTPEHDLNGDPRISYGTIDPGAYEFQQDEMTATGTISSNQIWAADTVRVTGNVTLNSGYQLRILPGVVVDFEGSYQLDIKGQLIAAGTEDEMIVFTASDTGGFYNQTHTGWKGIRFWDVPLTNDTSYLENVIIEYGKNSSGAGGVIVHNSPKLVLKGCEFRHNMSSSGAGGLVIAGSPIRMENCFIHNNYARRGGGIYFDYANVTMSKCTISNNYSEMPGGGIHLHRGSNIEMVSCQISNNHCQERGGGMYSLISGPKIINSLITNNTSELEGGGMYFDSSVPEVFNTNITNNHSYNFGGGLCFFNSNSTLYNSIISGNQADTAGNQVYLKIDASTDFYNCDIEGDSTLFGKDQYAIFMGEYTGNIKLEPQFILPSRGAGDQYDGLNCDWGISDFSACINAGITSPPDMPVETLDFAGNPRINNDTIDIGASENQSDIPQILNQLENQVRCMGDSVAFSVDVSDTSNFQWYMDGAAIPGENESIIVLGQVQVSDQGNYQCWVSNAYGISESSIAFLTVNLSPDILIQPEDVWIEAGETWEWSALINGTPPFIYQWQKDGIDLQGAFSPKLILTQPDSADEGTYLLKVANSCSEVMTDPFEIYVAPQICVVTVSETSGDNLVVWEKNSRAPIREFNVYRESSAAGIYDKLATIPYDDLSVYVDTLADPTVQAYLYKITAVDTAGNETDIDLCNPHKTIHLLVSTNPELNTTQLEWDNYYGFDYQTYNIYRSNTGTNFALVHDMSASLHSWSDPDPQSGDLFYRIAVERLVPCYPTGGSGKAGAGPYHHALSNLDDNKLQTGQLPPDTITLNNFSINEENIQGAFIGRFFTEDPDSLDSHVYHLIPGEGDDDNYSFTLAGDLLLAAEVFDFETQNTYTIRVRTTDLAGNYFEYVFIIQILDIDEATGLPVNHAGAVKAYPNPFKQMTTITFPNPQGNTYTMKIMDLSGKVLMTRGDINSSEFILRTKNLATGYYLIELKGRNMYRGKLVVK